MLWYSEAPWANEYTKHKFLWKHETYYVATPSYLELLQKFLVLDLIFKAPVTTAADYILKQELSEDNTARLKGLTG